GLGRGECSKSVEVLPRQTKVFPVVVELRQLQIGGGIAGPQGQRPLPRILGGLDLVEPDGGYPEAVKNLGPQLVIDIVGRREKLLVGVLETTLLKQEHRIVVARAGEVPVVGQGLLEVVFGETILLLQLQQQRHPVVGAGGAAVDLQGLEQVGSGHLAIALADIVEAELDMVGEGLVDGGAGVFDLAGGTAGNGQQGNDQQIQYRCFQRHFTQCCPPSPSVSPDVPHQPAGSAADTSPCAGFCR